MLNERTAARVADAGHAFCATKRSIAAASSTMHGWTSHAFVGGLCDGVVESERSQASSRATHCGTWQRSGVPNGRHFKPPRYMAERV
jgi:hypothetical protein